MAAGKFFFYDRWIQYTHSGEFSFISNQIEAMPLHSGYTPGTHSHSVFAQVSGFRATASGTVVNAIALSSKEVTQSSNGTIKLDADNLAGFSAGGDTFKAKYIVFYAGGSASMDSIDQPLMGFFDTDTGASTGIESTQLNVTFASGGIGKVDIN